MFELPHVSNGTTSKTIRFPNDMIDEIKEVTRGTNVDFSKFVIAATRAALDDLKEKDGK